MWADGPPLPPLAVMAEDFIVARFCYAADPPLNIF